LIKKKVSRVEGGDMLMVDVFYSCQYPWSGCVVEKVKQNIKSMARLSMQSARTVGEPSKNTGCLEAYA